MNCSVAGYHVTKQFSVPIFDNTIIVYVFRKYSLEHTSLYSLTGIYLNTQDVRNTVARQGSALGSDMETQGSERSPCHSATGNVLSPKQRLLSTSSKSLI